VVTYSTTATSDSPAGTYPIIATVTGSSAGNYGVVVNAGTLIITSATSAMLTVTANNAARVYGAANPTFSGTVTGAQKGDAISESFATTAAMTSAVGSYPIVPSVTGPDLADYTVTIVNGTLTVTAAATTIVLSAPASATYGTMVTLTGTVASTSGTPGGIVTFNSGSTILGTGTLNTTGVATLSTAALPTGSDAVSASYAALGNFAGSASPTTTITVKGASQTITFPAIASRVYGSAPFAVTASSSLGSSYQVTITVLSGPATISGGLVTVTGVGTVVLQATQAGGGNYDPATATQSFQVTPAATATSLNAPASAAYSARVTLTATVTSTAGMPAGNVTFYNGATTLGVGTLNGSGVAMLNTTAIPAGTNTVTATYAATGDFAGSSSTGVTLMVGAAPVQPPGAYTIAANPTTLTVVPGGAGKTTLTLTPTGGYSGIVSLTCLSLPANASCAFATKELALSGNDQSVVLGLTINTTLQQTGKHVPSQAPQNPLSPALFALAFWFPGGLTGLAVLARRRKLVKTKGIWHLSLLLAGSWALAAGLLGCGMSGYVAKVVPGISQVTVMATGTSGTVVSTQTVALTLDMVQ
jgi:Bacterial Ig-like domain (group 3)/MBG domain (YGX type)